MKRLLLAILISCSAFAQPRVWPETTDPSAPSAGQQVTFASANHGLCTLDSNSVKTCPVVASGVNAAKADALTAARAIYGNNFDGSAALTQIIASIYGGTGNGFTKFSGPASTEKTFTLPNSNQTLTYTLCAGTVALGTGAISSGAKASTVTMSCTGATTTDIVRCSGNADISAVTGYVPSVNGTLGILPPFATTDTINVIVENNTGSSVTPGAVTLNCGIWR